MENRERKEKQRGEDMQIEAGPDSTRTPAPDTREATEPLDPANQLRPDSHQH